MKQNPDGSITIGEEESASSLQRSQSDAFVNADMVTKGINAVTDPEATAHGIPAPFPQHFSLASLVRSNTAVRLGIDNSPNAGQVEKLRKLAENLERLRAALGGHPIFVNSGYRCELLEKVLCQKDFMRWHRVNAPAMLENEAWPIYFARKAHPKCVAADILCPELGTPIELVRAIELSHIPFDQVIIEGADEHGEGGWCHVSFDPIMRHQVLTATFVNGSPIYSVGV